MCYWTFDVYLVRTPDTSALVKRYHVESGTDTIDHLFGDSNATLVISRLAMVEVASALALKVRMGEIPISDYGFARNRFLGEIKNKNLSVVRLLVSHYRDAEKLIHKHAPVHRLRTLDALQLAIAKQLTLHGRTDNFVSADLSLLAVAALEGLKCLNPATT